MNILGIGFLSEASACLLKNGKLVAAISEERLNRKKFWYGYPEASINQVLEIGKIKLNDIDFVATHGFLSEKPSKKNFEKKKKLVRTSNLPLKQKKFLINFLDKRYSHEVYVFEQRTPKMIATIKRIGKPTKIYSHHHCHAATAYYGSGWKDCFVITADGWGEDGSHTFYQCKNEKNVKKAFNKISFSNTIDSLGYFYGSITKALGFIPHRHEGKILGLAAYKKKPKSLNFIKKMISFDPIQKCFKGNIESGTYLADFDNPFLISLLKKYSKKDIASATQITLENVFLQHIKELEGNNRLAVAGGLFANVKLNQKINESKKIKEIYVFPNMGDGGLSVGSAWLAHHEITKKYPHKPKTMYLGYKISKQKSLSLLKIFGLKHKEFKNINRKIAELLANKKIVARCSGRMEFGPRALGNRSILYEANDKKINKWLNKKLKRTEFMPFAPITKFENANEFFEQTNSLFSSQFMTITSNCTKKMISQAAAAVHVDLTARPQLVKKEINSDLYEILDEYEKITGNKNLINTSFNMHEEPIVCNENDAIRAFLESKIDFLVLNDLLIWN
jgi:carbamoyltransferase